MNKAEIIEQIAKARMVETMVQNIAHESLSTNADLSDLCQMVYLILLEYDEDKANKALEMDYATNNMVAINFIIANAFPRLEIVRKLPTIKIIGKI